MGDLRKLPKRDRALLFGAVMRQAVGHDSYVGLTIPCPRDFRMFVFGDIDEPGTSWCKHDGLHGHVIIDCEDGIGVVPVPFYSRPFLDFVLALLIEMRQISVAETHMLLETEIEKIAKLAESMTAWERKLSRAAPGELEKAFNFAFVGLP